MTNVTRKRWSLRWCHRWKTTKRFDLKRRSGSGLGIGMPPRMRTLQRDVTDKNGCGNGGLRLLPGVSVGATVARRKAPFQGGGTGISRSADPRHRLEGVWIESPMSSEQMHMATDDQILALFEELTDDTEWDHPRRQFTDFVGGSVQASREFANFASDAPHRAMKLIGMFEAGNMERPTGYALAELAKAPQTRGCYRVHSCSR